jgi:hypothetical protein
MYLAVIDTATESTSREHVRTRSNIIVKRLSHRGREAVSGEYVWIVKGVQGSSPVCGKTMGALEGYCCSGHELRKEKSHSGVSGQHCFWGDWNQLKF